MKLKSVDFVGISVNVDNGGPEDLYPGHPLLYVERQIIDLVKEVGLVPYLIPIYEDGSLPPLEHINSIIFTGGGYLNLSKPNSALDSLSSTGKQRYLTEKKLINYSIKRNLPMIGICRGAQMINEVLGGRLDNISNSGVEHHQERLKIPDNEGVHQIYVDEKSDFYSIIAQKNMRVNSFHRQHMSSLGKGLRPAAISEDGYIEVFESEEGQFVFGFQFHPEKVWKREPVWKSFFESFASQTRVVKFQKTSP